MQTQNLSPETVKAIMESPATRAAIAAREAARTRERADLLAALAAAELAAAVEADEITARIVALREAFAPLAAQAAAAREALQAAEAAAFAAGLSADAKVNRLRAKLLPLGGGALDAARSALAVEARVAAGALAWRTVTEHGMNGPTTRAEPAAGNVAASALLAAIEDAGAALDVMERDAEMGPAQIAERLAAMRTEIEEAKTGAPISKRGPFAIPHGDVESRRQVKAMAERVRR